MKKSRNLLWGISILPALLIMPAVADNVAQIGDTPYESLSEAILTGGLNTSLTNPVELLVDVTQGQGISVPESSNVVVDFGGNTYTGYSHPAGSTGTKTQVFQLLRDSNITFKNGTINASGDAVGVFKMVLQNYSNLTLDGVTVDGTNLVGASPYTLSNNNGTINIKNSTIIAKDGGVAFDVYSWKSATYGDVSVNVENSTITGKIELDTDGSAIGDTKHELTITGGTLTAVTSGAVSKISNKGTTTLNNVTMSGNTITGDGAAVYNKATYTSGNEVAGRGILNINGGTFANNSARYGGAVETINGSVVVTDGIFSNNTSSYGGAIDVDKSSLTIKGSTLFDGNISTAWGGAIYNGGQSTITGATFKNNVATKSGGAIATNTDTTSNLMTENVLFENNHAELDGGAVANFSGLNVKNSLFRGNTADYSADEDGNYTIVVTGDATPIGGGAIALGAISSTSVGSITGTTFENNKSGTNGGAIGTRRAQNANNSAAKLDIAATFLNNSAVGAGGAIYNTFYADNGLNKGDGVTVSGVFTRNSAGTYGGAIYNDGTLDQANNDSGIMTLTNSTFTENVAATGGGAIYNTGTLALAGTNTFYRNTDNTGANDIHNLGIMTVASGATTIDGGISGTGILTIAEGATLDIGTASVTQGTVTLNGTMLATLRDADDAQLNVTTFDDQSTGILKLAIRGAGTYNVFGDAVFAGSEIETSVYDWDWSEDGKDLIATMKSVEDIATDNNLTHETAIAVAGLSASTSEQLNDLAVVIQEKLSENTDEARAEVEHAQAAIHPETESVVQSVSSSVQSTVTSLASGRMSMPTVGRNGGDVKMTSGGVWAQGIFNKSKQNDAFNGYTRGIAAGMDGTINKNWTIGAGYAFAHSDVTATARDTEIDSSSVFLYGQYKPSAWYVNAIANYTMSDYSEKGIALGTGVTADYDVNAYGANVATGYDFAGGVTPELALRYMHVDASDYTNSLDVKNKLESSDYLTASLGTKYAFDIKATKRLTVRPELRYAVKYDIVSDKQTATVTMPGVNSYVLDGERLSRIGGEFGIGMGVNYKGFDLSLNYDIEAREDYTSQSGRVKFRYNF